MLKIIECVPNFSEGQRREIVDAIAGAAVLPGVQILDLAMDASHNRSVLTLLGEPEAVIEAAFRAVRRAAELIDMDAHRGEHPRIGAADVVPLVPVMGVDMAECVMWARELGRRIGDELGIPVYLYGEAALRPERRDLPNVRRGQYEGLKEAIASDPDRRPDFGPTRLGKAGATAVGARKPLIAFNVNLATPDLQVAKAIARRVREASGGLPAVRALGVDLSERGMVQVSMNLLDYEQTPIHVAFEAVRAEAHNLGISIAGCELVGLVPLAALCQVVGHYLMLEGISTNAVLEARLLARCCNDQNTGSIL